MNIKGLIEDRSVYIDGKVLDPAKSQAVYNHSPDGFCWGYGGSGPAQLALAILLERTDKDTAVRLHQEFKAEHIIHLPVHGDFEVNIDVDRWIQSRRYNPVGDLSGGTREYTDEISLLLQMNKDFFRYEDLKMWGVFEEALPFLLDKKSYKKYMQRDYMLNIHMTKEKYLMCLKCLYKPLKVIPLYMNTQWPEPKTIVRWRLNLGR